MTFVEAALQKQIVIRSLKVAAVVGTILVGINYGDRFFPSDLSGGDWVKIMMTYCVPYCVATYSAASTMVADKSD